MSNKVERSDGRWMLPDGHEIDGRWVLPVVVTDVPLTDGVSNEVMLRVEGGDHIGKVILQLVEEVQVAQDWSDYGLWWPKRNVWLARTRSTLDQYGVNADVGLVFTPMHKILRVQLPDLQYLNCRVDYSAKIFSAIIQLCKELAIRYPEELSLCRVPDESFIRKGRYSQTHNDKKSRGKGSSNHTTPNTSTNNGALNNSTSHPPARSNTPVNTLANSSIYTNYTPAAHNGSAHNISGDSSMNGIDMSLAISPQTPSKEAQDSLIRPKNMIEKARLNSGWLDSSLSLMEQGIRELDVLQLRYKFFTFYDLQPKYDAVRINQVYEQARWSVIGDDVECTEEEGVLFAALQLQAHLASSVPEPDLNATSKSSGGGSEDEIDAALTDLQISLEGSVDGGGAAGDLTAVPELSDYLHFMRPRRFTLKSYKRVFLTFKDTYLSFYRSREDSGIKKPVMRLSLRGCEVSGDVATAASRYIVRLLVPSTELDGADGGEAGMSDVYLKCSGEEQYARWMAACKLAIKGKTMADSSYDSEVSSIIAFLHMQQTTNAPDSTHRSTAHSAASSLNINADDFMSPRLLQRFKSKALVRRIQEAHANVADQTLLDAKMNYIRAWQSLPEYGIRYFTVRFRDGKKEEVLGVAFNRLIRMDLQGHSIKTWRFNTMKEWKVNWEVREVQVEFEEETVAFIAMSADCKQVHEFIGGYIFLSMRSKDSNQALDEDMFHRLTGGWQ